MAEEKEQFWAWTGDELISLGAFESFAEADEEAMRRRLPCVWIYSKEALEIIHGQIEQLNLGGKI